MSRFLISGITSLILLSCGLIAKEPERAEEIDDEFLAQSPSCSSHIGHFQKLFSLHKVKNFLEFGLGYSTKYFLDHCDKVLSVEFVTNGAGPEWIKKCLNLYKGYSNWVPITYFTGYQGDILWAPYKYMGSDSVYKATSYQTATHQNYAFIDPYYISELNTFIHNITKYNNIEIASVNSNLYLRGDLVQLLFDKVPIILAHDTDVRHLGLKGDVYGYSRIETPENYEELFLFFPTKSGTTIWISKEEKFYPLIDAVKKYITELKNLAL